MSDRGLNTRAVHAGERPNPTTGASAPDLVMSTTFVMDQPAGFSINAFDEDAPYVYTRWGNPTVDMLEAKLADLEAAEDCVAFASGMAATSALLLTALKAGDHLVISDVNYPGTAELVRAVLPQHGIAVTPVNTSDLGAVEAAMTPATRMVWIETPANPILRLTDIAAVSEMARQHGALLAVDSTFATPVATRPIELGADYVVHSLTKYICGHGDALGGAVLCRKDLAAPLRSHARVYFGGALSPFNAWLIARGAATLPLRMRGHQENAHTVATFLEGHPSVTRVTYPGLASHPQHELARRQMANFAGMVSFQVNEPEAARNRMATELHVIHHAVSLGHHRSLIYWLGTDDMLAGTYQLTGPQADAYRAAAGDGLFRLSVGLEDADDLCADLDHALRR